MIRRVLTAVTAAALFAAGCTCGEPISPEYFIGGSVDGLAGSGLVLQLSGGSDLAVSASGSFQFPAPLADGTEYAVTVKKQPASPSQLCTVSGGAGVIAGANVDTVKVTCATERFSIGGVVTGLKGSGLALRNNGGDDLNVTENGNFVFPTPVESGAAFAVEVAAQPTGPSQTCVVSGGSGTVVSGAVTSVTVNCSTDSFTVSGTVSGLLGAGLVLQNNGGDDVAVNANGTFAFATPVASGEGFSVEVKTQPSSPWQTCSVTNGVGSVANTHVASVAVHCELNTYVVGGTVTGLAGSGLVLQNNLGDDLPISSDGTFAFPSPIESGGSYAVTVLNQPTSPWQSCTLAAASGVVSDADVSSVQVVCTTNSYSVGGTVTGLVGSGLVLTNNGGDDLQITADGSFAFTTPIESGAQFSVSVSSQPDSPTQTCVVMGGTGTMAGGPVSTVTVNCTINEYVVGGTVTGLAGSGLSLSLNAGAPLSVNANGSFAFPDTVASGMTFEVTLATQPVSPWQTCAVSGGSGTVTNADITSVGVSCVTNTYPIEVSVTGLSGSGLVLQNNGGDNLQIASSGTYTFTGSIASGSAYDVTVLTQPSGPSQTCTVSSPIGTVGGSKVSLAVTCTTNTYAVGGTVSGLNGAGLVLQNNGGDDLVISANGTFAFSSAVASGAPYAVTVKTHPSTQYCTVANGNGTVGSGPVTSVAVTCVSAFTSCRAAYLNNPNLPNGNYSIDADGPGPLPVVTAYCDMAAGGHTLRAVTHNWGEWGANMTIVIRDRVNPATGSLPDWQSTCAVFGKANYAGTWKNTGRTYTLTQYQVYADSNAWWNNVALKIFPTATYNDFLILQDAQSFDCWAHYAEAGSLASFGSPSGSGYAFCRGGQAASKRYHIYLCLP